MNTTIAPLHILAQVDVFFSDEDFFEVFIWGVIFVFVIILLFVINRLLRVGIGNRIRSKGLEFGMTTQDIRKMKDTGQLTPEEFERIKKSMSSRYLEMAKYENERRDKTLKAEIALRLAEEEARKAREAGKLPEPESAGNDVVAEETKGTRPPLKPLQVPPAAKEAPVLPSDLAALVDRPIIELEEMNAAGFISDADLRLVLDAREARRR